MVVILCSRLFAEVATSVPFSASTFFKMWLSSSSNQDMVPISPPLKSGLALPPKMGKWWWTSNGPGPQQTLCSFTLTWNTYFCHANKHKLACWRMRDRVKLSRITPVIPSKALDIWAQPWSAKSNHPLSVVLVIHTKSIDVTKSIIHWHSNYLFYNFTPL